MYCSGRQKLLRRAREEGFPREEEDRPRGAAPRDTLPTCAPHIPLEGIPNPSTGEKH